MRPISLLQLGGVPLLGVGVRRDALGDQLLHHLLAHLRDRLVDVVVAHDVDAVLEDDLALVVHHVVVLEHVLAGVEVARLDLLLRLLQRLVDPGMGDGLAFLQAELLQHAVHAVRAEDAHQVVLERQVELGAARVALAAGAAAQLVVDAPALVALGAEHVEAAGVDRLLLLLGDVGLDLRALGPGCVERLDDGGAFRGEIGGSRLAACGRLLIGPGAAVLAHEAEHGLV